MMIKIILPFVFSALLIISCSKDHKQQEEANTAGSDPILPKNDSNSYKEFIDTTLEYSLEDSSLIIIENSFPKGGRKYIDPSGQEYVYAVFWTNLINKTSSSVELTIDVPASSFELPSSPENNFKLITLSNPMDLNMASMNNYGLTNLDSILDSKFKMRSSNKLMIDAGDSEAFYFITLFKYGLKGTIRTGLHLDDEDLLYKVNDQNLLIGKWSNAHPTNSVSRANN